MITFNCEIEAIASRKDNTLKITIGTQEITEGGKLFTLQNKLCSIGIVPKTELSEQEIKLLQESKFGIEDVPNGKSQSQRLRGVLYVYFTQNQTGFDDFNDFYHDYMEKRIQTIKSKLEP